MNDVHDDHQKPGSPKVPEKGYLAKDRELIRQQKKRLFKNINELEETLVLDLNLQYEYPLVFASFDRNRSKFIKLRCYRCDLFEVSFEFPNQDQQDVKWRRSDCLHHTLSQHLNDY